MSIPNTKTLGRGLSSLIGGQNNSTNTPNINFNNTEVPYLPKIKRGNANQILSLPINQIKTNPYQPRESFEEISLQELTASIKEHGILQPLLVTQTLAGEYELIAGERRLRAGKLAGLKEVPVIVRSAKELEKLELSLIENIQRQDLNPIEKAESYKKLLEEFGLSHDEAARRLGISRSQFSNTLRLLSLPPDIQQGLSNYKITLGQAKVILEVKDDQKREQLYRRAIQTELTVSDIKKEADKIKVKSYSREIKKDPFLRELELRLQEKLNTKVMIKKRGSWGGIIEIEYY
nr:ParB/RepB/Spo0J family partition protein [bacterium]